MASTYLTRTQTTGNRTTFTFSAWVKRSSLGEQHLISCGTSSTSRTQFHFNGDNALMFYNNDGGSVNMYIKTNRLFRDVNAWYHIVLRFDTTQATASDRIRFYVNGEEETSLATNTIPSQNADNTQFNYNGVALSIGRRHYDDYGHFDGSMSHVHFCDGQSYDASSFGQADANGVWTINTTPSVTYGTNGYFILEDGNSVTDQSGNSNNWTVAGGTLTNTEDNPSNVFATMNPLSAGSDMTFGNGNTKIRNDQGTWNSGLGTIAPATGKYYWEAYVHGGGDNNIGVSLSSAYGGNHSEVDAGRIVYSRNGYIYREGLSGQSNYDTGVTYGDTDIIGVAFDTENGTLSFYKNGSAVSNSTTTDTSFLSSNNEYLPQCGLYNGGEFRFNFGNGYFGTTAVSSAGTNASGIGIFEYDVPTGYTALSTKGLNL